MPASSLGDSPGSRGQKSRDPIIFGDPPPNKPRAALQRVVLTPHAVAKSHFQTGIRRAPDPFRGVVGSTCRTPIMSRSLRRVPSPAAGTRRITYESSTILEGMLCHRGVSSVLVVISASTSVA